METTPVVTGPIVIVGGGIAGAATAWALAASGAREVTVLEREDQLGAHSTSKNASILRTLTEHAATTRLALETAAFLHAPPAGFSPVPLVDPVGLVLIPADPDAPHVAAWRAAKPAGTVRSVDAAELAALAPHIAWRRGAATRGALLVADEGHIDTSALLDGLVRAARALGVRFRTGAEVSALKRSTTGRVEGVRLAGGEPLAASRVVIAAGGWAGPLARAAGSALEFEPRRRHLLVTAPSDAADRRWPIVWSEPDGFYVRPESGGLMICACDQDVVAPDECGALPEVREQVARTAARCLVGFDDAPAAHFWAGLRTFATDDEFAVGPDPDVDGLFWVAGLGGHGMSTSIGVGRLAAALLRGAPVDPDLARALAPERLAPHGLGRSASAGV